MPLSLLRLSACLLALAFAPLLAAADVPDKVRLQLKWYHQFQFAGYYAAVEKGYYRDAGLDVELLPAKPGEDPIQAVLDGRAEFGVGTSSLLLLRNQGKPVVVLATIFQHSPLALVMRQDSATQTIHDIVGKRAMIEPHSDELFAYFTKEGIDTRAIHLQPHTFNPQDLIAGKVDAMSVYITDEPFFLEQARLKYLGFTPRSAGIDFYGDNLFTTEEELRAHPDRVKAFREASLRGWEYAMEHPEEIIALILQRYSQRHSRDYLAYEARHMAPLIRPDLVELGYMNPGRWRHIADTYADLGMLPRQASLDGFLYDPHPKPLPRWVLWAGGGGAAFILLGGLLMLYVHRINRQLRDKNVALAQAESELRASEQHFRLLAESSYDVIWTLDVATGRFTYVSPSVVRLRGYTVEEVLEQSLEEALTPDSLRQAREGMDHLLAHGEVLRHAWRLEQPCKDGSTVWTEVNLNVIRNADGSARELLGVTRDITEQKRLQETLDRMAHYDELTGLPNRALFFDRLRQALAEAKRDGTRLALLFLDLDGFKEVNDTCGHTAGDELLRQVARRLAENVRASDTVARMGGDEFTVILRHVATPEDAAASAEKIIRAIERPVALPGGPRSVGASIGISLHPEHGTDEEALLSRADTAMYAIKHGGKNAWRIFGDDTPDTSA